MAVFRDEISRRWRYGGRQEFGNTFLYTDPVAVLHPIFVSENATWPKVLFLKVNVGLIGSDISSVNFQIWSELYVRQVARQFLVDGSTGATFSTGGNALIGYNALSGTSPVGGRLLLRINRTLRPPPFTGDRDVDGSVDLLAYN